MRAGLWQGVDVSGLGFNRGVDIGERIAELTAEVKRLNDLYYGTGDSPLPDADYDALKDELDRKSTRLNSSHQHRSRMPSSA